MTQISRGVSAVGSDEPTSKPIPNTSTTWTGLRHLLDTKSLSAEQAVEAIRLAKQFRQSWERNPLPCDLLKYYTVAGAFYENSTRTRGSFELAARRLGATVLNLDVSASSTTKGETLIDTARTLAAMGANLIIQRHGSSGSAQQVAYAMDQLARQGRRVVSVVNAGDGCNEHPTQALLDLMTMSDIKEELLSVAGPEAAGPNKRVRVTIVGDILHSRVARSNIWLLNKLGVEVNLAGPPTLLPEQFTEFGVTVHHELEAALQDTDFVIVLRMQFERQQQGLVPGIEEYTKLYRVDHARLKVAAKGVRVLHPGPVNRDLEMTGELADDESISLVLSQAANGTFMRMAALYLLTSQHTEYVKA